jgi:hypothetical protein
MRRQILWWIAPAWCAMVGAYFVFGPSYGTTSTMMTGDGSVHATVRGHASGLAVNGASMLFPMSIPMVMVLVPLFVRNASAKRTA